MELQRVAVVQAGSKIFDLKATIDKMASLTKQAADKGAKLVLFPESFIGGYPKGLDFGARVGLRTDQGREDFKKYFQNCLAPFSREYKKLQEIAKQNQIYLITGVMEQLGSTLYCSVFFFSPQGELLGKHRKVMPTASERLIWGFGDGSTLPVIDTELGKIGAVICWENYMPLLRTYMYSQGIQIYLAPTVDCRESWLPSMRHIAMEGRCFVLSACQYMTIEDCPKDYPLEEGFLKDEPLINGGSLIISPMGEVLAGPSFGKQDILFADLDLSQIIKGKYDLDVAGHYARPDLFQLHVNTTQTLSVVTHEAKGENPF